MAWSYVDWSRASPVINSTADAQDSVAGAAPFRENAVTLNPRASPYLHIACPRKPVPPTTRIDILVLRDFK
jgi:hypothetical protein